MKEMASWIKATSDIMVRVLLGQTQNIDLLKDFINAVLKDQGITPVKSLTIENPVNLREVFNEKESILDVKAVDESGRILDVEIQSRYEAQFTNRSLYDWAKLYSSQLITGDPYETLNPVICINLLDFSLKDIPGSEYHSSYMITKTNNPDVLLSDHLRIHFIELPKIKVDPSVVPTDRLVKWMYYFKEEGILEDEEMKKIIIKDDPLLEQAHETFKEFTADKEMRAKYEAREKWEHDQASLRYNAKQQGRNERSFEVAEALLDNGVSPDIICKTTGLSPEELEALKKKKGRSE